jgi:hypothetical protein
MDCTKRAGSARISRHADQSKAWLVLPRRRVGRLLVRAAPADIDADKLLTSRAYTPPRLIGPVQVAKVPGK